MKKTLLIPAFALAFAGFAASGSAQSAQAFSSPEMAPSFFDQLAARLGVRTDMVESATREIRLQHKEDRLQQVDARLDEAVANGDITQEQRQAILDHHEEMQEEHESDWEEMRGLSREERRKEHEEHRADMEAWAVDQGIDLTILHELVGGQMARGHHQGMFGK